MSAGRSVLHLVRGSAWPAEIEVDEGDTVVFLGGTPEGEAKESGVRVLGSETGPEGLLDLVFGHDVVLTW
ncbi:MAG: hypothetical protein ACYS99_16950 [Planctomycetota bacterium]|jgi:hypothetical protein